MARVTSVLCTLLIGGMLAGCSSTPAPDKGKPPADSGKNVPPEKGHGKLTPPPPPPP